MSSNYNDIRESNKTYSENFGDKKDLPVPPIKNIVILTCMDSRLEPLKFAGLNLGDAHIVRNAGGRASDDAIRSLIISYKMLGTNEFYVIHHSDCGLETFTNEDMKNKFEGIKDNAQIEEIDWLTIEDREGSVRNDVEKIKNHPLVADDIKVYGFIYDVKTGKLIEVN